MFGDNTFTASMLSDPSKLMSAVIGEMEARDAGNGTTIDDPNNGFVMLTEAMLSVEAALSQKVDNIYSFYYRQRARNSEQLYPHLSQYNFTKLMASPAVVPFQFSMSRDWIVQNAVYYDENYDRIQIPDTSYFTMGGIIYSMYYPIDILVNRNTKAVSAFYNTSKTNSLFSLETNSLIDTQSYFTDGLDRFVITFNMYQFARQTISIPVSNEQGFIRTLSYTDKFYSLKVFSLDASGVRTELAYSLSSIVYDYSTPTALITLLSETNQVKVEIPQVYFNNGQIARTIIVELYTTLGKVNYAINASDILGLTANFDTTSTPFAAPLEQMPVAQISPTTIDVIGGSDPLTYAQLRPLAISGALNKRAAITQTELTAAAVSAGFDSITREIDDVTDRMYYVTNTLKDSNGFVVPTFTGAIKLADAALQGDPSSIIDYTDGYFTILPTTIFKMAAESTTVTPLSDGDVSILSAMTQAQLVDELNTGKYVRQPFHISFNTAAKSPSSKVYNMMAPTMTRLAFLREHPNSAPQMSIVAMQIAHLNDGTGGYQIRMTTVRSANIKTAAVTNFRLILTCRDKLGDMVYYPASYVGTDVNGNDVWEVVIATTYRITNDNYFRAEMYGSSNTLTQVELPISTTFTVLSAFVSSFDSTIVPDTALTSLLPTYFVSSLTVMTSQSATVEFAKDLSPYVDCTIDTTWGSPVYSTAPATVYHTTTTPIFQTTEAGVINYRVPQGTSIVETVEIYGVGDTPADSSNFLLTTTGAVDPTSNGSVIPLSSTEGLLPGMTVGAPGFPPQIKIVSKTDVSITVSEPATSIVPVGTSVLIINPSVTVRTSAAQGSAGISLTVPSTTGIIPGLRVAGFDISKTTTVARVVDETTIELSEPTTAGVAANTLLTIFNATAPGVVKVRKGAVLTDAAGVALIASQPKNEYLIQSILFDGRLFESSSPADRATASSVASVLSTYAAQISSITAGLLAVSDVYYRPTRSMGNATFGLGNNQTARIPLGLSFDITVFLDRALTDDEDALSNMTSTIYSMLNDAIQQDVIKLDEISKALKDSLGTNVSGVVINKMAGLSGVRLMALEETNCRPCISNKLVIKTDGSIVRTPDISITYVPKPDSVSDIVTNAL